MDDIEQKKLASSIAGVSSDSDDDAPVASRSSRKGLTKSLQGTKDKSPISSGSDSGEDETTKSAVGKTGRLKRLRRTATSQSSPAKKSVQETSSNHGSDAEADINDLFGEDSDSDAEETNAPVRKPTKRSKAQLKRMKSTEKKTQRPQRKRRRNAKEATTSGHDQSEEYDSGQEVTKNADDDAFIDRTGDDQELLAEYEAQQQDFNDQGPARQESNDKGDWVGDDISYAIDKIGESRKGKRKRKEISQEEKEEIVRDLLEQMIFAAESDREQRRLDRPAINKLKLVSKVNEAVLNGSLHDVLLEGPRSRDGTPSSTILHVLREWLRPLAGDTMPTLQLRSKIYSMLTKLPIGPEHLRMSRIGEILMVFSRHPSETNENKRILHGMIETWLRPIFRKTDSYRDIGSALSAEAAAAQVMSSTSSAAQASSRQPSNTINTVQSKREKIGSMRGSWEHFQHESEMARVKGTSKLDEALAGVTTEHGTKSKAYHAHVPAPVTFDFVRAPVSQQVVASEEAISKAKKASSEKSELKKRMMQVRRNSRKKSSMSGVNLSLEGRGL